MKVQILRQGQTPIQGYNPIFLDVNRINLEGLADNQCEMILAADIFESISYQNIAPVLQALLSKLRLNGELVVGGTEMNLLGSAISNGLLTDEQCSNILGSLHCALDARKVADTLRQMNLSIQSMHMDGIHFEIKAKRG